MESEKNYSMSIIQEQLGSIMEQYQIGKKPLAKLLGWGDTTIMRYLNGVEPNREFAMKIQQLAQNPFEYIQILEQNKERITQTAYKKSKSNTSSGTLVKKESALTVRATVHIFVMAICLFVANYLQTAATADFGMSSQLMYPIIRGGTLVTVNIVSAIFFGETMTRRKAIGSLVAILGVVVMSLV